MSAEFWWISRRSSTLYLGLVASGIWGILPCSNYKIDHVCDAKKNCHMYTLWCHLDINTTQIFMQSRCGCHPDVVPSTCWYNHDNAIQMCHPDVLMIHDVCLSGVSAQALLFKTGPVAEMGHVIGLSSLGGQHPRMVLRGAGS